MQKKVSIIIVNWNGIEHLKECFDSLTKIKYSNYEIIFVDNGSLDNSVQFIRSEFSDTIILKNEKNLGFAEGNNVGMRYALKHGTDYILLLNNDTTVHEDFLCELIKVSENDDSIGIVGSKVYFMNIPNKICFAGGKRRWTTEWKHIGLNKIDIGQYNEVVDTDFIYGCALMIKRKVLENVGLFDPDYFTYVEEIDMNYRVKKMGYRIVFVPNSKVWHKVAGSDKFGRVSPNRQYYITRNNLLFLKKYGNFIEKTKFLLFVLPKWFIKNLIYLAKSPKIFISTTVAIFDFIGGNFGKK